MPHLSWTGSGTKTFYYSLSDFHPIFFIFHIWKKFLPSHFIFQFVEDKSPVQSIAEAAYMSLTYQNSPCLLTQSGPLMSDIMLWDKCVSKSYFESNIQKNRWERAVSWNDRKTKQIKMTDNSYIWPKQPFCRLVRKIKDSDHILISSLLTPDTICPGLSGPT